MAILTQITAIFAEKMIRILASKKIANIFSRKLAENPEK
jgi:hypothetical protein